MLVLSRKAGERLLIGEGIVLTVERIGPKNVVLGIEAPAKVRVLRGELIPLALKEPNDGPSDNAGQPVAETLASSDPVDDQQRLAGSRCD